jgi:hypothetical protein
MFLFKAQPPVQGIYEDELNAEVFAFKQKPLL